MTTPLHLMFKKKMLGFVRPQNYQSSLWLLLVFFILSINGLRAQCTFAEEYTLSEHYQFGDYCPAITSQSGSLSAADPVFTRPNGTAGEFYYYERFDFFIDAIDVYTFSMPDIPGEDFYFALYQGGFNPGLPNTNLLATDDDGGGGFSPELMLQLILVPGNYTLVTTTFSSSDAAGGYNYSINSASGGNVLSCFGAGNPARDLQETIEVGFPEGITPTPDGPMLINICFAGDLNTEYLEVRISNQLFYIGNLGYATPSIQYNAYCRDFVIPAGTVATDLIDGDIDIDVRPYVTGGDWVAGDDFAFSVTNVSIDFTADEFNFVHPADGELTDVDGDFRLVLCPEDGFYDFNGLAPDELRHVAVGANTYTAYTDFVSGDLFTDTGGTAGDYVDNESGTTQICAPAGETITLNFTSFNVEAGFDDLNISGSIASDGSYDGTTGPGIVTSNPGGCLTFAFNSDLSVTPFGWEAIIAISNDDTPYRISPADGNTDPDYFDESTGVLDISIAPPGIYTVSYFNSEGPCTIGGSVRAEVIAPPIAQLKPTFINCNVVGNMIDLSVMFDGANAGGGLFSQVSGPPATISPEGFLTVPDGGGCFEIQYAVDNETVCGTAIITSAPAQLLILLEPMPLFTTSAMGPICNAGGTETIVVTNSANPGANQLLTVRSNNGMVAGNPAVTPVTIGFGNVDLSGPAEQGSYVYTICLTESNNAPTDCLNTLPADDPSTMDEDESTYSDCSTTYCQSITIYNDGVNCQPGAGFASECDPDPDAYDVCGVEVKNSLDLSCSFFTLNGPQLIEAEITNAPGIIQCTDDEVCFDWQGSLPGDLGDIATGGPTLGDLNPAASVICDIITFEFCIPLIVTDLCIDPIPLGSFEDACDQTIGQIIFTNLGAIIGGDGGSGIVVADTDGDGNFDQIVEEYTFPASSSSTAYPGQACVPNNIQGPSGTITLRNVTSWPFDAAGTCGDVTSESINLLELLPIGAIPIVGIIIEDLLAAASCNVDLVFSDEETVEIPVYNNSVPVFSNCPENGYVFSEDGVCDTEANWSIPVAFDGCSIGTLEYKGFTNSDGMALTYYNVDDPINLPDPVNLDINGEVLESGLYQTAGPLPGSDLDPGTYTIIYTAYSCSGTVGICTFDVVVSAGDPMLACPGNESGNITVKADADLCTANVTGLAPVQGLSCATVVNYDITYPAASGLPNTTTTTAYSLANRGIHNDASGLTFPVGVSTIEYTMMVDLDNDGAVTSTVDGVMETQTCSFTLTVQDEQPPSPRCIDIDVQLDNTGNVTVYAAEQMNADLPYIDGGSTDNCGIQSILVGKGADTPTLSVDFNCTETGYNLVTLHVTDTDNNTFTCLSQIHVEDFFEGIAFDLDLPEICLEANNDTQLDFSNYLVITLPDGTVLNHHQVENNPYLGEALGGFGITAFAPDTGAPVGTVGSITPDGVYTPGTGSGFITVSYLLALPDAPEDFMVQNGMLGLSGCVEIVHSTFELRQPLDMASPECECIAQNDRVVNLGVISGGLEPYTIQFSGVRLDVDNDAVYDDMDGEFTYQGSFTGSNGITTNYDNTDFSEDLGNLLVDYTQPTWSFTVVDARGCELFRSGSCDNPDSEEVPEILCEDLGPVNLTTEEFLCERQYVWDHTLPTDNCDVILYTYTITNPDGSIEGPFDLTGLLNPDNTNPLSPQFRGVYEFQHDSPTNFTSTVTYYAEDATGNNVECSFQVNVIDDIPPRFINCPEPAVIVDAPPTWCSAYANYSLPLAVDNCDIPVVTQVDDTGLTSGDIYPVGITINTFEAVDLSGNTTRCDVKIIVNDYHTPPTWECPENVVTDSDPGDCGAIVDNIAPFNIDDNCIPNLTVAYRIDDADGNEIANGLDDASGTFFDLGTSTVSYSLQDMPLLLITEVTHDLSDLVDGTIPVPDYIATAGNPTTGDYLEITNFNSATLDVSCLQIERVFATGKEIYAVPTFTILEPGGVLIIHFGNGTDAPADHFFNVPDAVDLPANEPAAYIISLSRSILDVAIMNNYDISSFGPPAYNLAGRTMADYWSGNIGPVYGGGIVRTTVWDTNTSADFVPGEACIPTTIGTLNPMLPQPVPNGAHTAIQAQPTTRQECSFTVEVSDDEDPICGLYGNYINYAGAAAVIDYGKCVEIPLIVTDAFSIADLNLLLAGSGGDFGNLTFTLISPEGTAIELLDAICPGSNVFDFTLDGDPELADPILDNCANLGSSEAFVPVGNIEAFNGEAVQGTWILQIGHNGQVSTVSTNLTAWSLDISAREAYTQGDETLENDLDLCGAEFTWLQSILFDNCAGGSISFTITFEDGTVEVSETLPIFPENTPFTHFFTVGVTQVTYVLTDAQGNTSTCGFEVTVLDTQFPEITCPPDLVIQLDPGECDTDDYPTTPIFEYDNCPAYVLSSFPPGTPVPIGDTIITLIITDASGNVTECTYNLTVLEHIPTGDIACVADQNVSLGPDCMATITADMLLSGNDYRCYDNYIVTLYPDLPDTGVDPIATSPVIGEEFVGQTIVAEICDPATGLCCWGYVHVDFYDAPEFICPPDAMVTCIESTHPDALGYPVVTSCVPGGATIEFDDEVVDNGTCGEPRLIISRTWTVTDGVGNFSQCVQNIVMAAFDLDQVIFPESYDGIDNPVLACGDVLNDPSLTSVDSLGVPTIDGQSLYTAGYCTAAMNYEDDVFTICENSYIIFRQWRVINQCLPNPLASARTFTQTIRVEDLDGPNLVCPADETISVSPFNCEATYLVPPLVSIDACSAVTYQVEVDGDTLVYRPDNLYILTGLDLGDHTIRYLAKDACNKLSNCSYTLTVEDQIAPTASCNEQLVVSLGGGDIANDLYGEARILAADVNEGSNDNCSAVTLAVRRNYWQDGTCDESADRWSPWAGYIDFYCCDINQEITIELRATDIFGNENTCWMVITPEDKLNPYCYAPEDVSLTCNDLPLAFPGDIQTAYDEDFAATSTMMSSIFGGATGTDNCAVDTIVERTPNIQVNDCGWGTITRRFEAWQLRPAGDANANGAIDINEVFRSTNSCNQVITITEVHNFVIDFPEDADADCGDPNVPTIITTAEGCDVLTVNIGEPVVYSATGDECYKLSITYDVINWCLWDGEYTGYVLARMTEDDGEALPVDRAVEGNERPVITYTSAAGLCIDRNHTDRDGDSDLDNCASPQLPNYGRYIYTQFVKVYDSTVPVITVGEYGGPTDFCPTLEPGQFGDVTGNCEAQVSIPFTISDECELFDGAGNLVISLVSAELDAFAVDINGDGDITSNEFLVEAGAAGNVMANITDNGDGTYSFDGSFPIITSAMGDNIYHAVRVLFEDGCGNQVSETLVFDVIDCKGPAPICINGLTATLMPQAEGGCAMTIWASDFEGSPIYDCTGQGPLTNADGLPRVTKYAIYRAAEVEADPNFVPHPTNTGLVLTEDDDQTTVVYVYAFDEEGNYDYCETYVLVQPHNSCNGPDGATIAGVITTTASETIEGVEVSINGAAQMSMTTGTDGAFNFEVLQLGGDYTVTPYHNDNPLNGVTTFDIVLISKHILNIDPLDSPYQRLAADVNNSETITTLDLIQVRKLILNITTEFTNNTSWRFIPASYVFPNELNPWQETFPELININNLSAAQLNADFIGVKTGDVNGNAQANALAGDDRTLNGIFYLEAEDIDMKAGNTYTVAVRAQNLNQIEGYQGTLQLCGAELVDIEYGQATEENFGLRYANEGAITTSWNHNGGRDGLTSVSHDDVLVSLVLKATEDQPLREALSITSRYTVAEAYPSPERGEQLLDLGLVFSDRDALPSVFTLYQNTPNPFAAATLIGFNLPAAQAGLPQYATVTVTINDARGRILTVIKGDFAEGYNTINVTKQMIQGATGVLSYTVEARLANGEAGQAGDYRATKQMIVID
ncbi:HYR domain-containing protein [Lewinella sp. LCG006]|uniref:HYR domain-containing protein n=1 Tax=Lewinella sp. LCG006 TaxID=3231911 RepID=UPI00345FBF5F